ncbi:MAG: riboflavin synthase [Proteobacteria bacterium]|nr:riboflavin synthase [Pseudomonadota bacterium]
MFTGIITAIGNITEIKPKPQGGVRFVLGIETQPPPPNVTKFKTGNSLACNGICFTLAETSTLALTMDVSPETLAVTTASTWQVGQAINLESALTLGDPLGGHFVTGHVDGVGEVIAINQHGDNWQLTCQAPQALAPFIAQKGSVAMDGVSLTINNVEDLPQGEVAFQVMLIPHTWQNTIARDYTQGSRVNLEADLLARYVLGANRHKSKRD